MTRLDMTYKSNTIAAVLRHSEEYVQILCSHNKASSTNTEEQIAVLMETVLDSLIGEEDPRG